MSFADYNEFIQRDLKPRIQESVFQKKIDALRAEFPNEGAVEGDRITEKIELTRTSPVASYDKSDVNPSSASNVIRKPYWDKEQFHTAAEVHGIDISNSGPSTSSEGLIEREVRKETESLMDNWFDVFMTQIKADVDATTAYSDLELNRTTFPTLVSYEEANDTPITLALMRGMKSGTLINKNSGDISGYVCLIEQNVSDVFLPLAGALHTLNTQTVRDQAIDMGIPDALSFENLRILDPSLTKGMVVGDIFMLRSKDVIITEHRPLEFELVPSGRDSVKVVIRWGINVNVLNPGFQGKMTDKD